MAILQISLFGRFRIARDGSPVSGLEALKAQELLSYLLLYRDHTHPRETLAGILWGDKPSSQSRKYLRQALWQVQGALTGTPEGPAQWLLVDPDWLRVNSHEQCCLDVELFERAFAVAQGVPGQNLDEQQALGLKMAADIYQGDLLEGWYQDWCLFERERLQNMYLTMLEKLLNCCETHGDYELGLAYGVRVLRYDHARERTHRRMMRLYYLTGERTAALRQYERCVEALRKELGVAPTARTQALYQQIREDRLQPIQAAPRALAGAAARRTDGDDSSAVLADTLKRLKSYQLVLGVLQQKMQRDIRTIESILGQ